MVGYNQQKSTKIRATLYYNHIHGAFVLQTMKNTKHNKLTMEVLVEENVN